MSKALVTNWVRRADRAGDRHNAEVLAGGDATSLDRGYDPHNLLGGRIE